MIRKTMRSAIYCGHANECPAHCDCDPDCYCQFNTCRLRVKGPTSLHGGDSTQLAPTPFVHLYAQAFNHDEGWVVGNRRGLTALRDALSSVLEGPSTLCSKQVFTGDGEGYVMLVSLSENEPNFLKLVLPYTDPEVKPSGEHPTEQIGLARYREAVRAALKEPIQ